MRAWLILPVLLSASSCSSEVTKAQEQLQFLENNNGTPRELCAAATNLADAAMRSGDVANYKSAQVSRQAKCTTLSVFPGYADIPGGVPKPGKEIE